VCRLETTLAEDGEGDVVRAAVHRAAMLVAVAAETAPQPALATNSAPLPLLRDGAALRQAVWRRFRGRCLLVVAAVALTGTAFLWDLGTLAVVFGLLVAVLGFTRARAARALLQRLEWLEVLACIEGPDGQAIRVCPSSRHS
jgi:hypothetical protein